MGNNVNSVKKIFFALLFIVVGCVSTSDSIIRMSWKKYTQLQDTCRDDEILVCLLNVKKHCSEIKRERANVPLECYAGDTEKKINKIAGKYRNDRGVVIIPDSNGRQVTGIAGVLQQPMTGQYFFCAKVFNFSKSRIGGLDAGKYKIFARFDYKDGTFINVGFESFIPLIEPSGYGEVFSRENIPGNLLSHIERIDFALDMASDRNYQNYNDKGNAVESEESLAIVIVRGGFQLGMRKQRVIEIINDKYSNAIIQNIDRFTVKALVYDKYYDSITFNFNAGGIGYSILLHKEGDVNVYKAYVGKLERFYGRNFKEKSTRLLGSEFLHSTCRIKDLYEVYVTYNPAKHLIGVSFVDVVKAEKHASSLSESQ
ncbi:MAG TPA: hypothetical protein PLY62_08855 [Bacteroidales bacterium]|nr:hypothetical protein [Bacteroidales bacterium]